MVVMEELHCKQEQIKDEKERRQNQYDESIATEKLKLKVEKKKISRKSKI